MMNKKKMFPVYIDLSDKKILVVGGGTIAERRIKSLSGFAGSIRVVAPEVTEAIEEAASEGTIKWEKRKYISDDILNADIVLGATDSTEVNNMIYNQCREKGIVVNISSDKSKCDFHFPGLIQYEDIVIGFNSGGNDHRKTRELREKVQNFLEEENWKK